MEQWRKDAGRGVICPELVRLHENEACLRNHKNQGLCALLLGMVRTGIADR